MIKKLVEIFSSYKMLIILVFLILVSDLKKGDAAWILLMVEYMRNAIQENGKGRKDDFGSAG